MALAAGVTALPFVALAGYRLNRSLAVKPAELLELYSYEGSPFCRIAREALCELELPHQLHNVPRRSPDRDGFVSMSGKMQVPYLLDPNTGVQMFESREIRRYLYETYALSGA